MDWHTMAVEEVSRVLRSDPETGLSQKEAARRLEEFGPNALEEHKGPSIVKMFLRQFNDTMVLVLLGAASLSFFLGEMVDAVTITAIVMLNALLGLLQEYRAERSIETLKELSAPMARVVRDGHVQEIAATQVVPGDVVLLEGGNRVPADARVLVSTGLEVSEAAITGESLPVRKGSTALSDPGTTLGDRTNMVYMGTTVTRGRGRAMVVATGMDTEMGNIAHLIEEAGREETPLQKRLAVLGRYLVVVCLAVSAVVSITGYLHGETFYRMFLAGISLAVAAIPEGLPAIVTICLALGVQRMVRRGAIIRSLPAVETLGCATVICSDKTGTLTRNEMTVVTVVTPEGQYEVTGHGYDPRGRFLEEGKPVAPAGEPVLVKLLETGYLCNNAWLERRGPGVWEIQGDPTEGALKVLGTKGGIARRAEALERVAEVPFEPERRMMSVICRGHGGLWLYAKGAPATILARCSHYLGEKGPRPLTGVVRDRFLRQADALAGEALRVLALAYREVRAVPAPDALPNLEEGLTFLGLVGIIDPPRPEVGEAVRICRRAGIRAVMITGDHKYTAAGIAARIGLPVGERRVLTGDEVDRMSDYELERRSAEVTVYARVSPRHKLRIVRALRSAGEIVAMTGDGLNDAPAVKEADIGVAMGRTGTDVTREAADMVLVDDNFATIVAAVEQGRGIYDNIRKFIRYLLACNVGEVLVMFLASILGLPLPLLPIQILWVNLVTDGLPAVALGVDPTDPDIMQRPPRAPQEGVFARGLAGQILLRGALIGLSTLAVFIWGNLLTGSVSEARTMAFACLVMSQLLHAFDCRSETRTVWDMGLFTNPYLCGAVMISLGMLLAVIYLPFLQPAFKTYPLSALDWGIVMLVAGIVQIALGLRRMVSGRGPRVTAFRVFPTSGNGI